MIFFGGQVTTWGQIYEIFELDGVQGQGSSGSNYIFDSYVKIYYVKIAGFEFQIDWMDGWTYKSKISVKSHFEEPQ